jgi:hypothetical protein
VALEAAQLDGILFRQSVGSTVRAGERDRDTAVDPQNGVVARAFDGVGDAGEGDVPLASLEGDPVGLGIGGDRAGQPEAYPSGLRDQDVAPVAIETPDVARLHSHDAEALIQPFDPPAGPTVRTPEEVASGLVEIPKGLLLHDG